MGAITEYLDNLKAVMDTLSHEEIETVAKIIKSSKRIYIFGNGGSGATASHFVNDFNKGLGTKIHCLNDNISLLTAYANDVSYDHIFMQPLVDYLEAGDTVIGISGSGNSRNIINAIEFANANGAMTVGFCGMTGGELKKKAQYSVHVSGTMQESEDLHLIIGHIILKLLS